MQLILSLSGDKVRNLSLYNCSWKIPCFERTGPMQSFSHSFRCNYAEIDQMASNGLHTQDGDNLPYTLLLHGRGTICAILTAVTRLDMTADHDVNSWRPQCCNLCMGLETTRWDKRLRPPNSSAMLDHWPSKLSALVSRHLPNYDRYSSDKFWRWVRSGNPGKELVQPYSDKIWWCAQTTNEV